MLDQWNVVYIDLHEHNVDIDHKVMNGQLYIFRKLEGQPSCYNV